MNDLYKIYKLLSTNSIELEYDLYCHSNPYAQLTFLLLLNTFKHKFTKTLLLKLKVSTSTENDFNVYSTLVLLSLPYTTITHSYYTYLLHSSCSQNYSFALSTFIAFVDNNAPNAAIINTLIFYNKLFYISKSLTSLPSQHRQATLEAQLTLLNSHFPLLFYYNYELLTIVHIHINECCVLNSAERVPFILSFESTSQITSLPPSNITPITHMLSQLSENSSQSSLAIRSRLLEMSSNPSYNDPSIHLLSENYSAKLSRIRSSSPYAVHSDWTFNSFIIKTHSDLRHEQFALILIQLFADIWSEQGVSSYVFPFNITVFDIDCGIIEQVKDAVSIHSIKKLYSNTPGYPLLHYFILKFGTPDTLSFQRALDAFIKSLAGYSLVSYVLLLKDRHNGNILLDSVGHLIHIDFGFMLDLYPGNVMFEQAPFKLTKDYLEILGESGMDAFILLLKEGMKALRKEWKRICEIVDCVGGVLGRKGEGVRERLWGGEDLSDEEVEKRVVGLVERSKESAWTVGYDRFQWYTQGVYM